MPHMTITKVIREHVELECATEGMSVGEMVDKHIAACIQNGDEIQTVSVEFGQSDYQQYAGWRSDKQNGAEQMGSAASRNEVYEDWGEPPHTRRRK